MTVDVERLISAAQAIEAKTITVKSRSATFSRLATKARKEGKLDPEDHLALEAAKQRAEITHNHPESIKGAKSTAACIWMDQKRKSKQEIKEYVEKQLAINLWEVDVVLTHTAPLKYEPTEVFLEDIDQSRVDKSTEQWLDKIEEMADYKAWYCGHWHINKRVDKMHFLFHGIETN